MIKILHVIQGFYRGGSGRALIATAKYSSKLGSFQHRVVSLGAVDPGAIAMAEEAGLSVAIANDTEAILHELENADIVHLHFWNNPQMYEFLQSELPAMRLLIWFHVAGDKPPQILTKELVDYSDFALACSPYTYEHPVFQNLPAEVRLKKTGMVYGAADFERVADIQPKPHDTFNVGFIGHVSFAKMYPNYVPMSGQVTIPNVQFIVCGGGIQNYLQQQAQELGVAERFDFRGPVEDIKSVIEILDVYGYPLCEDTYAASELNLQEVMYGGVPPVVFPYGGVKRLVIDNFTGLIVCSELEYKQAIEYLYHHPEERARLGRNAKDYAQQIFGAENAAKQINPIYERLIKLPKRTREWGIDTESSLLYQPVSLQDLTGQPEEYSGAEVFAKSLGNTAPEFTVSLTSQNIQELFEAEQKIATSSILLSMGEGGIVQYREYYPNDSYLRLWSGLVRQYQGRYAEAVSEWLAALNLGLDHWRVSWYLAQAATNNNDFALAEKALRTVVQAVPDFAAAQEMLKSIESASGESIDLDPLKLRDINLIIFPDWSLSEDTLSQELASIIRAIATHPDRDRLTLLVDTSTISDEDAELAISGVVMNLLMEEDVDVAEGLEISLLGNLSEMQWKALLPRLQARIILEHENQQAIAQARAETLPTY
ncbi:MAG: glycosyltransferase [Coleofasciculus sp. S288]|nr:glycosyltransferase [Coleofasciculus sp. S288]